MMILTSDLVQHLEVLHTFHSCCLSGYKVKAASYYTKHSFLLSYVSF